MGNTDPEDYTLGDLFKTPGYEDAVAHSKRYKQIKRDWHKENLEQGLEGIFSFLSDLVQTKPTDFPQWLKSKFSQCRNWVADRKDKKLLNNMIYGGSYKDDLGGPLLAAACAQTGISPSTNIRCEKCGAIIRIADATAHVSDSVNNPVILCGGCADEFRHIKEMEGACEILQPIRDAIPGYDRYVRYIKTKLVDPLRKDWNQFLDKHSEGPTPFLSKVDYDNYIATDIEDWEEKYLDFEDWEEKYLDLDSNEDSSSFIESVNKNKKDNKKLDKLKKYLQEFPQEINKATEKAYAEVVKNLEFFGNDLKIKVMPALYGNTNLKSRKENGMYTLDYIDPITWERENSQLPIALACEATGIPLTDSIFCEKCGASCKLQYCHIMNDVEGQPRIVCGRCKLLPKKPSFHKTWLNPNYSRDWGATNDTVDMLTLNNPEDGYQSLFKPKVKFPEDLASKNKKTNLGKSNRTTFSEGLNQDNFRMADLEADLATGSYVSIANGLVPSEYGYKNCDDKELAIAAHKEKNGYSLCSYLEANGEIVSSDFLDIQYFDSLEKLRDYLVDNAFINVIDDEKPNYSKYQLDKEIQKVDMEICSWCDEEFPKKDMVKCKICGEWECKECHEDEGCLEDELEDEREAEEEAKEAEQEAKDKAKDDAMDAAIMSAIGNMSF